MSRFSLARTFAIFLKECQQMLRDRLTFAMAVGVPILQLVLFGYAITGCLAAMWPSAPTCPRATA